MPLIEDANLFMMCPRPHRGAFTPVPHGFSVRPAGFPHLGAKRPGPRILSRTCPILLTACLPPTPGTSLTEIEEHALLFPTYSHA